MQNLAAFHNITFVGENNGIYVVSAINKAIPIKVFFFPILVESIPNKNVPGMVPNDITANISSDCFNVNPNPPFTASPIIVGLINVPTIKL